MTKMLEIKTGENKLQFEGAGIADGQGLTINNVKLIASGSTKNLVVNGDFSSPNVGTGYTIKDNIPGWLGKKIEIGYGKRYNSAWTGQVAELDAD